MPTFHIEKAREQDCPILVDFIRDLALYERLSDQVEATPEDIRRELFQSNSVIHAVIAWLDDVPIGFAIYFYNFSTFLTRRGLYLEDLFIAPEHRSRGYGKAMMRYLAQEAIKQNCGRFEWSVLEWNTPAIGFYESLGAAVMHDWRICRLSGSALAQFAQAQGK